MIVVNDEIVVESEDLDGKYVVKAGIITVESACQTGDKRYETAKAHANYLAYQFGLSFLESKQT